MDNWGIGVMWQEMLQKILEIDNWESGFHKNNNLGDIN